MDESFSKQNQSLGNTQILGNYLAVLLALLLVIGSAVLRLETDNSAELWKYRNSPDTLRIAASIMSTPSWAKGDQSNYSEVANVLEKDKLSHPLAAQMYITSQARLNQKIDPEVFKVATSIDDPFASAMHFIGGSQVGNRLSDREYRVIEKYRIGSMFNEYILRTISAKAKEREGIQSERVLIRPSAAGFTQFVLLAGLVGLIVAIWRKEFSPHPSHPLPITTPKIGSGWAFLGLTTFLGLICFFVEPLSGTTSVGSSFLSAVFIAIPVLIYVAFKKLKLSDFQDKSPNKLLVLLSGIGSMALAFYLISFLTSFNTSMVVQIETFSVPAYWLGGPIDIAMKAAFLLTFPIAMTAAVNYGLRGYLDQLQFPVLLGHLVASLPFIFVVTASFVGIVSAITLGTLSSVVMYKFKSLLAPMAFWAVFALAVL